LIKKEKKVKNEEIVVNDLVEKERNGIEFALTLDLPFNYGIYNTIFINTIIAILIAIQLNGNSFISYY
jgi:hypothetical protein